MRVLITSIAAYGHLQPLLPLAKALADAGHEVAIATGPDLRLRAEAAGFTAFNAGITFGTAFELLAERFPDEEYNRLAPAEILGWYLPHLFGETLAPAMLDDLEPLVRNWQPDIVLHDTGEFAGPLAAASAGIPSVSQTPGLRTGDRLLNLVAVAVAALWRQRGLDPDPSAGLYRHLCLDTTPPGFQPDESSRHHDVIRPLRPVALPPLPGERLPQWINERQRGAPLVHMTLGTITNSNIAVFRSVIDGLSGLDVDVLITTGFGSDPAAFGPLASNIHVERYVPQSLLLPHCAAVICHGGAGTTLSALALGLPLLILPQGADQYIIGDLVLAAGA
ncbi:MAG TPA: nucleotide disphospho-sugar-binding domain-containing protein, partial [Ktedonobacteraceae bacterium]|nr:nucleotide disphospho-sugar-binding domain-containing protein [Ktedonobacteraceae bacterium]